MKNRSRVVIICIAVVILLIPLVAMQFSEEVNWSSMDFITMGVLLLTTGLLCELVLRKVPKLKHRVLLCAGIVAVFLLIWAELAVGIFGTVFAGS
jgi:uncharacterized membrane protein (DUF441 family)